MLDELERGHRYYKAEQYEQALAASDKAIELDPDSSKVYILKGDTLKQMGRDAQAEQAYQKARELDAAREG